MSNSDVGCGLLAVGKALFASRQNHSHFSMEYRNFTNMLERYVEVLKELLRQREVANWMAEYRVKWSWVDHLLYSNASRSINSGGTVRKDDVAVIAQPPYIEATSRQYGGNSAANSDSVDIEAALSP